MRVENYFKPAPVNVLEFNFDEGCRLLGKLSDTSSLTDLAPEMTNHDICSLYKKGGKISLQNGKLYITDNFMINRILDLQKKEKMKDTYEVREFIDY